MHSSSYKAIARPRIPTTPAAPAASAPVGLTAPPVVAFELVALAADAPDEEGPLVVLIIPLPVDDAPLVPVALLDPLPVVVSLAVTL